MIDDPEDDDDLSDLFDAVDRGDQKVATELAMAAHRRGAVDPLVLVLVAEERERSGRPEEAIGMLREATTLAPDEAEVWRRLGRTCARQGALAEAVEAYQSALAIDPESRATLIAAGAVSASIGRLGEARDLYRRAAKLAPDEAELLSVLAVIASYLQDFGEARELAARALALRPQSFGAQIAIARADLREGDAHLAEARTAALLGREDIDDEQRISALDLHGDALDALQRPADAFANYQARNALIKHHAAPLIKTALTERRVDQARRLADYFSTAAKDMWRSGAGIDGIGANAVRGHVFLLGFPRSGTTLLEKSLAGHYAIVTLEEVDHLAQASSYLLRDNFALARLASLMPVEADTCREAYWHGVRKTLGADISGKILIDKLPLHTLAIPAIAKLFPHAKILFALRDPRDVVLSCFRHRFQVNSAMYEFLTLEGAARYYDRIMALAEIYRGLLLLDIHEVRHEAVVADFQGEMRKLLAIIGADWEPTMSDFAERARSAPRTPSDPQLARGLNADGVARWRRYEQQLTPVLAILEPWVRRFGYADT